MQALEILGRHTVYDKPEIRSLRREKPVSRLQRVPDLVNKRALREDIVHYVLHVKPFQPQVTGGSISRRQTRYRPYGHSRRVVRCSGVPDTVRHNDLELPRSCVQRCRRRQEKLHNRTNAGHPCARQSGGTSASSVFINTCHLPKCQGEWSAYQRFTIFPARSSSLCRRTDRSTSCSRRPPCNPWRGCINWQGEQ